MNNAQMIALLSQYPPDAEVAIIDLDTGTQYVVNRVDFDPTPEVVPGTSGAVRRPTVLLATAMMG